MNEPIPEKNLFMMCNNLNVQAISKMPPDLIVRTCRKDELDIWKGMPFDSQELARQYYDFMTNFFNETYADKEDLFFKNCLFVCDRDTPIATCFAWKSYNVITSIHWFKVLPEYEGKGIGRALLSIVMERLKKEDFPVFLHTQPSSYKAIKLYSDFGFSLLSDPKIGRRENHLEESLPILKKYMPEHYYNSLRFAKSPQFFLNVLNSSPKDEI